MRPQLAEMVRAGKAQLRRLETLGVPVCAAINGAALGGGLEICLAMPPPRSRSTTRSVQMGFPEVQLGLLPGAGGVVRTVRMLGIADALMKLLMQGQRLRPAQAIETGILDEVVATREELVPAAKAWVKERAAQEEPATQPWDVKGYKIPGGTPSNPKLAQNLPAFPANLRKQLKGANYPAPHHIMAAAVEGAQVDFDTAIEIEGRYFVDLLTSQVAKNMIQAFFFDMQAVSGDRGRPEGIEPYRAQKVVVLGAGMMGAAIAYVCAKAGIEVVLKDVSMEAAERGKGYSAGLLEKAIARGRSTQEKADELLARITPSDDAAAAAGADLVIEAVFEDPAVKAQVFHGDRTASAPRRAAGVEHLDAADHRARRGRLAAGGIHRAALLQPGRQDAAARDHQGREDERRDAVPRARPRQADQEDADRRQRQPRVLHEPRDRDVHQRGRGHAAGGRAGGLDRAGVQPGGLPRAGSAAQRRAQPQPRAQDPRRDQGRRRGRRRRVRGAGVLPGGRPPARRGPRRQARGRGLLRLRGRQARGPVEGPQRDVPRDGGPRRASR